MSETTKTTKTIYKTHYYQIVLKCLRAGGVTVQGNGSWIFAIVNLAQMVYRGFEYAQPCLYGRKNARDAIFGGIQHYQVGLPYNPIIKRVYKAWCKENPIDPKHKMKNEILWVYEPKSDLLQQLIQDWPDAEKQRRIEAAEEEAYWEEYYSNPENFDDDNENDYRDGWRDDYEDEDF